MAGTSVPRIVVVARPTEYAALLARHGTREQARFFLDGRGRAIDRDRGAGRRPTGRARDNRRGHPGRLAAGPGPALGPRPLPVRARRHRRDGRAVRPGRERRQVPRRAAGHRCQSRSRTRRGRSGAARAREPSRTAASERQPPVARRSTSGRWSRRASTTASGCSHSTRSSSGHASHQSARYLLRCPGGSEHQSSSGIVVTTGTGATGWGRSIGLERHTALQPAGTGRPASGVLRPRGVALAHLRHDPDRGPHRGRASRSRSCRSSTRAASSSATVSNRIASTSAGACTASVRVAAGAPAASSGRRDIESADDSARPVRDRVGP